MIGEHPEKFMTHLARESKVAGMRWDELVLNFEWSCQLETFIASKSLTEEQEATLRQVMAEFYCCFDVTTVKSW